MAGVYVKGTEMPKNCEQCLLFNQELDACNYLNYPVGYEYSDKRMSDCPLVEVPDHGALIDREELIKIMLNTPIKAVDGVDFDQAWFTRVADTACQFVDEVERQAAVIPADKEEVDE